MGSILVTSSTAKRTWYDGGTLYQAIYLGVNGGKYAEGEEVKLVLSRYKIHRFTKLSEADYFNYRVSYTPQRYFDSVRIQIWEYGETTTTDLSDELNSIKTTLNRIEKKVDDISRFGNL